MKKAKSDKSHWGLVFFFGLVLIIVGAIAVITPFVATITSVVVFGWLLTIGGFAQLFFAFSHHHSSNFLMHSAVALLTILIGLLMIFNPGITAMTITLLLAVFFLGGGLFRIFSSVIMRFPNWGWVLIGGILSLVLGIFILIHWPSSALWVIGLFIGIDLIFTGWSFLMASLVLKNRD